jgi:septum site-determining protein MinD
LPAKAYREAARRLRGETLDVTIPREKRKLFSMFFGRRAA